MTTEDVIRISRKYLKGVLTGGLLVLVAGWMYFTWCPRTEPPASTPAPLLLGVPDDFREKAAAAFANYPQPFRSVMPGVEQQDNVSRNMRLYEACPPLWPGPQETGDCVSMGGSTAILVRSWVAAQQYQRPPPTSPVFQPYQYGISRVQIGQGRLPCRSAGAYPGDLIQGFQQYGFITAAEAAAAGFRYSGQLADQWGCSGPPRKLIEQGKQWAGGDAYPIRSLEEWRDAIVNGYPCTVAIPWRPGKVYPGADGRSCLAFDGRLLGGHQICSLAYDGASGQPYWLLFNSHGANWPSGANHADGTPPGSIWIDQRWANWVINNGELWAISDVPGFQADELDLDVFNDLRLSTSR